jgi:hypothetical protein
LDGALQKFGRGTIEDIEYAENDPQLGETTLWAGKTIIMSQCLNCYQPEALNILPYERHSPAALPRLNP